MARKQKHEEHENHERWLVSYADFITLLFAFFVVMYSISSVNQGKYRVLSDAIVAAFRSQEKSIRPIQIGEPTRAPKSTQMEMQKSPGIVKTPNPPIQMLDKIISDMKTAGKLTKEEQELLELIKKIGGLSALEKLRGLANLEGLEALLDRAGLGGPEQQKSITDQEIVAIKDGLNKLADLGGLEGLEKLAEIGGLQGLEELAKIGGLEGLERLISAAGSEGARNIAKIADDIEQAMTSLIQQNLITVDRSDQWIEVEINTSILYPSGSAHLQPEAVPVLKELARILRDFPNPMRIEGFTDNVPINTLVYPSNWELSTARASRVVRLFTSEGIAPERMAAIGYGEYRPVARNDTAEGRSKNRRVVLVVLANHDVEDLFNSGVLKSGQRTAGFKQLGEQSSNIDILPEQAPAPERGSENITTIPQPVTPQPVSPQPASNIIQTPQNEVKINRPTITETTPLTDRAVITQDILPEVPVKDIEPVVTQPAVPTSGPVIFPQQPVAPGVIDKTAPVIRQPASIEPVITVPPPVLLPPIKFISPISKSIGGVPIENTAKPGERSGNIGGFIKQPAAVDRGRKNIGVIPQAKIIPDAGKTSGNEVATSQPPLTDITSTSDQSASMQTSAPAAPEAVAKPDTALSAPRPALSSSQLNVPGVINEAASGVNQPAVSEPVITVPSPVLLPPIKFISPISRPIGGVIIGNTAKPGDK